MEQYVIMATAGSVSFHYIRYISYGLSCRIVSTGDKENHTDTHSDTVMANKYLYLNIF
jgi:hypothetical protein